MQPPHCMSRVVTRVLPPYFDSIQNMNICWLTKEGTPTVELLAPVDENSPVNKILEKVGVSPYHCCYVVENLEEASAQLCKQKYIMGE